MKMGDGRPADLGRVKTVMSQESISVKAGSRRPVSMALPRTDDGNVHEAVGPRTTTSAAHFADANTKFGRAGSPWKQTRGGT
jgi:hypothetical protein